MYQEFVGHPKLLHHASVSREHLIEIENQLSKLAPDFVSFVKQFGRLTIDNGFKIYGGIQDMAEFFEDMDIGRVNVNAWVFGDNFSGEFYGFDKTSGKILEVSVVGMSPEELEYQSFDEFIREKIVKASI